MNIEQQAHGAVTVLRPRGTVVGADADVLRAKLLEVREQTMGRLVLDASEVSFFDSRGLEVLVEVTEDLARSGQALKICGLKAVLREVFEITDIASAFERFEDVNGAVRSFL